MSIKLENISYVYSPGTAYEHHALKDVSLEIPQGQFVGNHWTHGFGKINLDPAFERSDESNIREITL